MLSFQANLNVRTSSQTSNRSRPRKWWRCSRPPPMTRSLKVVVTQVRSLVTMTLRSCLIAATYKDCGSGGSVLIMVSFTSISMHTMVSVTSISACNGQCHFNICAYNGQCQFNLCAHNGQCHNNLTAREGQCHFSRNSVHAVVSVTSVPVHTMVSVTSVESQCNGFRIIWKWNEMLKWNLENYSCCCCSVVVVVVVVVVVAVLLTVLLL